MVIPLTTQHYAVLARNLLYTGVTQAKRLVVLVGQRRALAIAVRNANARRRWTRLREWLAGQAGVELALDREARERRAFGGRWIVSGGRLTCYPGSYVGIAYCDPATSADVAGPVALVENILPNVTPSGRFSTFEMLVESLQTDRLLRSLDQDAGIRRFQRGSRA